MKQKIANWFRRPAEVPAPHAPARALDAPPETDILHPICYNVAEWSRTRTDTELIPVREALTIHRAPAHGVEFDTPPRFTRPDVYVNPFYLARIPRGMVRGWRGVVVLPDGQYPSENIYHSAKVLTEQIAYRQPLTLPVIEKAGDYFVVALPWWRNYGHWLIDCLARVQLAKPYLPPKTRFVVPAAIVEYHSESLRLLGIPREQLELIGDRDAWEVENLWFAPMGTNSGLTPPPVGQMIARQIMDGYALSPGTPYRRIYATRRNMGDRFIVNDLEVEALLQTYGFETYLPGSLAFRDEIALFAETKIVVANSGAALMNTMFAAPRGIMLDLIDPEYFQQFPWSFASAMGNGYWYVMGHTVPSGNPRLPNLHVPISKLETALQTLLSSLEATSAPSR